MIGGPARRPAVSFLDPSQTFDPAKTYDALVIGSGITGGWAAKELSEKGLEVLVLEAGRSIEPETDYVEHVPPWEVSFRGLKDHRALAATQPIQRLAGACDEWASKFFVNDLDNPYTVDEAGDEFRWIRGRQVGGRSIMWGRQSYRWSDLDFEANARDGHGVDWPIRYADLAPWYDHVEEFAGIAGQAEGLAQLPDGRFLPPIEMNCVEQEVRERLQKAFGGARRLTPARAAVLTRAHKGRRACHYCGPCRRGCATRSYFSSLNSTLPAALATGRLTVRPHSIVRELLVDPKTRRFSAARVIDAQTKDTFEARARMVFLCASTIESARLLLNSTTTYREGLANSSGQVGRNLMDHFFQVGAVGQIDGFEDKTTFGRRPNSCYLPRYVNLSGETDGDFLRGYGFQGGCNRPDLWRSGVTKAGFGTNFKHSLRGQGPWRFRIAAFGECLPNPENRVTIDSDTVDAWGVPVARMHMRFGPNEEAMRANVVETAAETLEAAGAKNVSTFDRKSKPGFAIHEMGTLCMGRDPETSVLNAHNQAWDVPNLFATDGSCMASTACQNPSLTYMALTARACDFAVRQLADGKI